MKRLLPLVLLLAACAPAPATGKLAVVASMYPVAYLAQQIGGDAVAVSVATPTGAEPHDFEPSAAQVVAIRNAAVFLYVGAGVDAWADKLVPDLAAQGVRTAGLTDGVQLLPAGEDHHEDAAHEDEEEGAGDPHIWLDPLLLADRIGPVRDALIAADPAHAALYRANAQALAGRLEALHGRFEAGLASCERRTVIVSHNAFQYLANRHNLEVEAIAGLSPEDEPSPARMVELTRHAREEGIDTVFFETLASPKVAEAIATEAGARTMVLNPVEGLLPAEEAAGVTYEGVMEQNLEALRSALRCR